MAEDEMDTSVRVALRIRPQIPRELIDACRMCTQVTPGEPQIILGADKAFTFDYVFDVDSQQAGVYNSCVERLVDGALKGYNATVLAYGQTGSGKTFTMGTGFERELDESLEGIIPRAVRHMFAGIDALQARASATAAANSIIDAEASGNGGGGGSGDATGYSSNSDNEMLPDETATTTATASAQRNVQFSVAAQFMELYNEEIIDLLDPYNKTKLYKIHEDALGGICVAGATVKQITGPTDALRCLQQGALARTTASTQMNAQSSRSHALFTILIRRQRVMSPEESGTASGDLETLTSKFHFVDLAGSERLKRTGATGDRAREGISINCGLLSLGNVISALGDKSKKMSHVPYRDSKLTRLLQDSLGGNSQTLMIACISPSDRDFMETLNTLKYANRARNIKNRVQINQDQSSRTISTLRREIAALHMELLEYKQGVRSVDADGNALVTDTFHENAMLLVDNKRMQQRIKAMQDTIDALTERNVLLATQKAASEWGAAGATDETATDMIGGYLKEIEKLNARLIESEQMCQHLKKSLGSPRAAGAGGGGGGGAGQRHLGVNFFDDEPEKVLDCAKRELEKDRELLMSRSMPGLAEDASNGQNGGDNDSDSESESDSEDSNDAMQAELYDLSSDIELKSKLIEQLELSQQRMQVMRQHYEDKLNVLNSKIVNTQKERDQVLSNMSASQMGGGAGGAGLGGAGQPQEKIKKVRDEYERKLTDMQREMRKLQSAQKEHIRQQRELHAQEQQLRNLKNELFELKSAKIKLVRKISDENSRHKEMDGRRTREISQLRKEARKQLNTIKSLQAQTAAKDQVLKRRTEQVTALRKGQQSRLSTKAAGRVAVKKHPAAFTSRQAKTKWETVQRNISRAARSKQAVVELERELERLLVERKSLSKDLATVKRRQTAEGTTDLASEEDTLTANLAYIQENISHIQHSIMELEDGREHTSDAQVLTNIVDEVSTIDEAKFLLEKLCNIAIMQTCDIALSQTRLLEREAILDEVQQDSSIQQQLLQHVLSQNPTVQLGEPFVVQKAMLQAPATADVATAAAASSRGSIGTVPPVLHRQATFDVSSATGGGGGGHGLDNRPSPSARGTRSTTSSRSSSPVAQLREHNLEGYEHDNANPKTPKVRRRTAMYQDLLFGEQADQSEMSRSFTQNTEIGALATNNRSLIPLARVPSAPGSLRGLQPLLMNTGVATRIRNSLPPSSPKMARKSYDNNVLPLTAPTSPRFGRKPFFTTANASSTTANAAAGGAGGSGAFLALATSKSATIADEDGSSSPRTPQSFRRLTSREENSDVFSRLGAGTQDPTPGGRIRSCTDKLRNIAPLQCTHVVEGHSNSVLSVQVAGTTLYTASADRTVRVWDLAKASGPMALISHPGPVVSVVHDRSTGALYTACGSFVRVWDSRVGYSKPSKVLSSSGNICNGPTNPGLIQNGENPITGLCIGPSGNLYTSASDKVRIWDVRNYACLGKLSGGHQAAVMCVTSWRGPDGADFVATGSKDHYVKVFEVPASGGLVYPIHNLEPPHYDGVQSLAVDDSNAIGRHAKLFSGSRDSGIKRWNLVDGELEKSLNNAHKGWVSGMSMAEQGLLTVCRGGFIRLWDTETCDSLAEIKTDSAINSVVCRGQLVYTCASSGDVRIWRFV